MAWIDEGVLLRLAYAEGGNLKETVEVLKTELMNALRHVSWAVNVLDETNFPNKVSGGKLLKEDHSVPLSVLNVLEIPIPLVLPAQPISTTSFADCGGFFVFSPLRYPGGSWYFEAVIQTDSGGTATAELRDGVTTISSVSTTSDIWTVVRSEAITMPVSETTLTVALSSSSASYNARLWGARLIWIP